MFLICPSLQFQTVFYLVSLGKSCPKFASCAADNAETFVGISVSRFGIFVGNDAEKVGLSPETGKISAASDNAHLGKAHAVNVYYGKLPLSVNFIKQYVSRRKITVKHSRFMEL